jgi:hypothetical protein
MLINEGLSALCNVPYIPNDQPKYPDENGSTYLAECETFFGAK